MSGPILLILRIALALALYAFLGWALYTVWSDLKQQSRKLVSPHTPPLTVIVYAGSDTRSYRFTTPQVIIGRDPTSDCHLEDQTISAQHARLDYHHGQWWVEDLHSTNGTFLNQNPVSEPLVLTSGDQLRCGQLTLQIAMKEAPDLEEEFGG
jgi:hypothetical protein